MSDFPTTRGAYQTTKAGAGALFVAKLAPDGHRLVYSTLLGPIERSEHRSAIAVDSAGAAYVAGYTFDHAFPTTAGAYQTTFEGSESAFVAKFSPDGRRLVYATFLGGAGSQGRAIAVDSTGAAYVTGAVASPAFPITPDAYQSAFRGGHGSSISGTPGDAIVAVLSPTGRQLLYATFLGGSGDDIGRAIALSRTGAVYVALAPFGM